MEQLDLKLERPWGGRRDRAGRPRLRGRRNVEHRAREKHSRHHPVHVTMRVRRGLPPLREEVLAKEVLRRVRDANASKKMKDAFRVLHVSVQDDHVHFIVEAEDASTLARGAQGLAIRVARRVNALLGIRGGFWGDRFHSRELTTPRSVRNAIVYVLMNAKKHGFDVDIDPCSSAEHFDGFAGHASRRDDAPTLAPRTWLAGVGWRRHGLIRVSERPRAPR